MKIVFVGIYGLGERALGRLLAQGSEVVGVVTKPDRGPGQQALLSLVDRSGVRLWTPETPRDRAFLADMEALKPDLIAVAGYHLRIPRRLLRLPTRGILNTHLSLLPRYRGPCPWKWAILRGEKETGVSVHAMTEGFDDGDLYARKSCPIDPDDTGESLFQRLCDLGAETLAEVVRQVQDGRARPSPQDPSQASYDGVPGDEVARIRWDQPGASIRDLIRGLHPRPGAWTTWQGQRIRIRRASLGAMPAPTAPPGTILEGSSDPLWVVTGDGVLTVHEWDSEQPHSTSELQLSRHPFA